MLKINKYKIKNNKLNSELKIMSIADIHIWENYNYDILNQIIEKAKILKPTIICICGDIIDEFRYLENKENEKILLNFLNNLAKICPTFICLGSHDYFNQKKLKTKNISANAIKYWEKMIKNNANPNLTLLNNSCYEFSNIRIIGYTQSRDYYKYIEDEKQLIKEFNINFNKKFNDNKFTILMCHSPRRLKNKILEKLKINSEIDLILSGHMHDGLVFPILKKLPTTIGFVSPQKKFFPKNARGKKQFKINNHIINLVVTGGVIKFSHMAPNIFKKFNFLYNNDIDYIKIYNPNNKN